MLKYRTPLLILLIAVTLPLYGLISDEYVFFETFPYGTFVHSSFATGFYVYRTLLVCGVIGILVGLISPKIVYWNKDGSRKRILFFYGSMILLSIVVYKEAGYLNAFVVYKKKLALDDLYSKIVVNSTIASLRAQFDRSKQKLGWSKADSSSFRYINGFPYQSSNQEIIYINVPFSNKSSTIVIEISDSMEKATSKVARAVFLSDSKIVHSKPEITKTTPQIFKGIFVIGDKSQIFTPCGTEQSIPVDLSKLSESSFITINGLYAEHVNKKRFAIVSGVIQSQENCNRCSLKGEKLTVHEVFETGNERDSRCESTL